MKICRLFLCLAALLLVAAGLFAGPLMLAGCGETSTDTAGDTDDGTDDGDDNDDDVGEAAEEGSEENEETEGEGGITGDVSISGKLVTTTGAGLSIRNQTVASSYKVVILDTTTAAQKIVTTESDGNFTATVTAGTSYMVSFLTNEYNYIGTLATGSVGNDNTVPVALTTSSTKTSNDIGTITANTTSGKTTSDATLNADTTHKALTSGGIVAGGKTGEGTTDYESTVTDNIATASDPDDDNDGTPDIFDTDNNNNGFADEVDGDTDKCVPGTVALYVENYTTAANAGQPGFPTPDEVDANLAGMTQYQIHLEFTPGTGYSIGDISQIAVTAPSYVDSYGYVYANYANAASCFNQLWATCNGKKLILSNDGTKYLVALADTNLSRAGVLTNLFPGDTFVLTFTMANGTTHTCTRKINIVPKYFPYAIKKSGASLDTSSSLFTGWSGVIDLSWSLPSKGPDGMTYQVRVFPYSTCTSWNPDNTTVLTTNQKATSASFNTSSLPASGAGAGGKWSLQLWMTDSAGDLSHTGNLNFTTGSSNPCP